MRACARCGHQNPEPLVYCFQCGGRLRGPVSGTDARTGGAGGATGGRAAHSGTGGAMTGPAAGFAATVALTSASSGAGTAVSTSTPPRRGPVRGALYAVAHLWGYVRGRIRAEDRKRVLAEERRGAERMIEAALAELGAAAIAGPSPPPELAGMAAQVEAARQRRQAATADLANAEKLQAVEDLRLGREQAAAESEWKACTRGADEMDRMLRELEHEREMVQRELDAGAARAAGGGGAPVTAGNAQATEKKRAQLTDEFNSLRERAAALRASTTAARSKLDHATAARRTATAAMAAGFAAQTRARADADRAVSDLTAEVGRRTLQLRLPLPELLPRYARIDRLRQTIDDGDRAIAHVDQHLGGYDNRKLATGAVVTAGLLAALALAIWALVR